MVALMRGRGRAVFHRRAYAKCPQNGLYGFTRVGEGGLVSSTAIKRVGRMEHMITLLLLLLLLLLLAVVVEEIEEGGAGEGLYPNGHKGPENTHAPLTYSCTTCPCTKESRGGRDGAPPSIPGMGIAEKVSWVGCTTAATCTH